MRLVYFGTPEFAVLPLRVLLGSEHEVLAVVTQPDKKSGRGRLMKFCPVKREAHEAGLKILQPETVRAPGFVQDLKDLAPLIIVVVAYGQILPPEIIHLPGFGCVNIHASLLPAYRGAAPVNWAIINGEKRTGVTTMMMDEGMDTGPILLQQKTEITGEDTAGSLSRRLSKIGADLLLPTLSGLQQGNVVPVPQSGEASCAPLLKKEDGLIRWSKSADDICNMINGMNPWPCAFGYLGGERIRILKAHPLDGSAAAGVIDIATKDQMVIGTGRGRLSVLEVQPSGKPVMAVKPFLQGRKIKEGMRFTNSTERDESRV